METDKHLYKIFRTAPKLLFKLLDITTESEYSMTSVAVKDTVRTMDALFKPADSSKIHYVVEFQFQPSKNILARIFSEVAILSASNIGRVYNGIILFLNKKMKDKSKPWSDICEMEGSGFQIFYLDEMLERLKKKSPNHYLIALFAPLMEKDEETLVKNASTYYNQIKNSGLQSKQREDLEAVLIDWFMLRFAKKPKKEIFAMFALERSLESSVAYMEIIAIGRTEGERIGKEIGEKRGKEIGEKRGKEIGEKRGKEIGEKRGKEIGKEIGEKIGVVMGNIETLKELHADGVITDSVLQKREKKCQRQLTKLRKKYDQL